jgi:hypothetical protein
MAQNQIVTDYDDAGIPATASKTASFTIGTTQVIKGAPGRLLRVVVTTVTASAATTIYDNASAASGTALLVIPVAAAVGTIYDVNLPAVNGLVVGGAGTGAITVGYA